MKKHSTTKKTKPDIQGQYNKELKDSRNKIAVEMSGAFLEALVPQDNKDPNKVRGLKSGILVRNRDTGIPLHVLPNQYLLYRGKTRCYFPNNNLTGNMTQKEIGNSFYGAYIHGANRLKKTETKTSDHNKHNQQFPIPATWTNLGVGPGVLNQLITGKDNIAIGSGAASGQYGLTTGSGNVMLGVNSGLACITGNNNTFLGYNNSMYGASYICCIRRWGNNHWL